MNSPIIFQVTGISEKVNIGSWLFPKYVIKVTYELGYHSFHREFTQAFNETLINHFSQHPPTIGDIITIANQPFKIIKVYWDCNENRYVIWWTDAEPVNTKLTFSKT